jgi:FG-GAP-like repeat
MPEHSSRLSRRALLSGAGGAGALLAWGPLMVTLEQALGPQLALAAASTGDGVPRYGAGEIVGQVATEGGFVSQIAVADFNGDGLDDLLFTRSVYQGQQTFPVTVLLNNGHGRFADATSAIFSGTAPRVQNARELVVADFNREGRPDVFIADHGDDRDPFPGYQNTLILSAPGGKLVDATANLPQVFDFTHSAAAGDVNGDGALDIYAGNLYNATRVPPRILVNDGSGHFSVGDGLLPPAQTDVGGDRYTASLFVDVNGDGKLDLVLGADDHTRDSVVLLNDGSGHFQPHPGALPPKPFGANAIALDIASTDVDGDGQPDLIIAFTKGDPFYVGRWIQVLINNGDGTFRDETSTRLPQSGNNDPWPVFLELRDLNRDGRPDLGVRANGGGGASPLLFLGDAQGVFHPGPTVIAGNRVWTFVDAEGNGSNDIIAVDPETGAVSLFPELRQPGAPNGVAATHGLRSGIRITWQPTPRATGYEIQRGGARIGITRRTSFIDRHTIEGRSYGYRVRALTAAGPGPWSATVHGRRAR